MWCKSANMWAVAPIVGLIVQPDRGLCRSGPVGLVIECNVLLPQEVYHGFAFLASLGLPGI